VIGMTPQLFLVSSIGEGLEKIIDQNLEAPSIISLITSPDIYMPLVFFFILVFISIIIRKFFYR